MTAKRRWSIKPKLPVPAVEEVIHEVFYLVMCLPFDNTGKTEHMLRVVAACIRSLRKEDYEEHERLLAAVRSEGAS
jgi:hypothetical protein